MLLMLSLRVVTAVCVAGSTTFKIVGPPKTSTKKKLKG